PEGDPHRLELEDQADDLFLRHADAWAEPVRGWAGEWRFERGFLGSLTFSAAALLEHPNRLAALVYAPPIRRPCIRLAAGVGGRVLDLLAGAGWLGRLVGLELEARHWSGCLSPRHAVELFANPHLGRLRELALLKHHLDASVVQQLTESPLLGQLTHLDLSG